MAMGFEVRGVTVRRGGRAVLDGVSLAVPAGRLVALAGASGAGKTTLLRLANRLVVPDAGEVLVDGRDVAGEEVAALRRRIGYAAQGVGLFPHWTVGDNIAAVPWLMGMDRGQRAELVLEMLDLVELPRDFAGRMPAALSGGQASRVGLARALAARPGMLLLDEPFAALDPETRVALADRIEALHRARGLTTLLVTHDVADALVRAERIVVLDAGRVVADAAPEALLRDPHPAVRALVEPPLMQARRLAALGQA
jgi:osmoprotectant transport system ATP-binding protein